MRHADRSLFRHLFLSQVGTVLAGLLIVGLATALIVQRYMYGLQQETLLRQARQVNLTLQEAGPMPVEQVASLLAFFQKVFGVRVWLFDRDGRLVATSSADEVFAGRQVPQRIVQEVLRGRDMTVSGDLLGLSEPSLAVAVPWGRGERVVGGVLLHAPQRDLRATVSQVRETLLWASLAAVLVAAAIGWYVASAITRPLKAIGRAAAAVAAGRYDGLPAPQGADEFAELVLALQGIAQRLRAAEEERRRLEESREELLGHLAHELRAPLTAMRGFLEALLDGVAETRADEQRYLNVVYEETLHVARLVDNLLDLTRLAGGRQELRIQPLDPVQVSREVCESFAAEAREKGLRLVPPPEEAALPPVAADPTRLRQILRNLVGNALQFTQAGSVTVSLEEEGGGVVFRVTDTGPGIAPADLPRIWERFYKADPVRSRRSPGAGLGLAIVRELVNRHGGRVWAESQPGQGSRFSVWLPAWRDGAAAAGGDPVPETVEPRGATPP